VDEAAGTSTDNAGSDEDAGTLGDTAKAVSMCPGEAVSVTADNSPHAFAEVAVAAATAEAGALDEVDGPEGFTTGASAPASDDNDNSVLFVEISVAGTEAHTDVRDEDVDAVVSLVHDFGNSSTADKEVATAFGLPNILRESDFSNETIADAGTVADSRQICEESVLDKLRKTVSGVF